MILSGGGSYDGTTTVQAGATLNLRSGTALGSSTAGTVVQSGGALELQGNISIGEALTLNGTGISNGGALRNVSGNNSVTGGVTLGSNASIVAAAGQLDLFGNLNGGGNALTIGGPGAVTMSGIFSNLSSLTKDGGGILAIFTTSAFTGPTIVNSGTIQLSSGDALPDAGAVTLNGFGQIQLTMSEAIGSLAGTGEVLFDTAGMTLSIGGANASTEFSGVIRNNLGTGGITKTGTGTLILSGANTYTGTTTVSGGTLQIGNGGTTGTLGTGSVVNNAILRFNRSDTLTVGNAISGTGQLQQNGTGDLILTGANSYVGTTINAGRILMGNVSALGTSGLTFAGTGALGTVAGTSASVNGVTVNSGVTATVGAASGEVLTLTGSLLMGNAAGTSLHFGSATQTGTVAFNFTSAGVVPTGASIAIDGGTLRQNSLGGLFFLNVGGGMSIAAGATYDLNGFVGAGVNLAGAGTITNNGGATAQFQALQSGTATFGGTIQNGMSTTSLLVRGGGTLILTGTNTYTGGTTFSGTSTLQVGAGGTTGSIVGNVTIGAGATLRFNRSDASTFSGTIIGSGMVTQAGTGSMTFTGSNSAGNDFTGQINVNAGTLIINGMVGDSTNGLANLIVGSGGGLGGSGTFYGDVSMTNGGRLDPGNSPGTLTIAGDLTLGAATMLNFELGEAGAVGGVNNDLVIVGGNLTLDGTLNTIAFGPGYGAGYYRLFNYGGTLTDNGLVIGSIAGGFAPTVLTNINGQVNLLLGPQVLQYWDGADLTGASSATNGDGGTGTWNAGNTNWTAETGFGVNDGWRSTVGIFAGASGGTVTVIGTQTFQELRFQTDGYVLQAGAGGQLSTTAGFSVIEVDTNVSATIGAPITGADLTKTGAGTLVLTGANTYTGLTTISAGTLSLTSTGTIAGNVQNDATFINAGTVGGTLINGGTATSTGIIGLGVTNNAGATMSASGQINGFVDNSGTFDVTGALTGITDFAQAATGQLNLNGFSLSLGSLSGAGGVDLGAGAATLTIGSANLVTGFSGAISGQGDLVKVGTGTLVLTGANTYAGGTTISGGILQIGNGGTTGSVAGDILNNAALVFNRSDNITYAGVISGNGSLTQAGIGELRLTGTNSYAGGTIISAGTLIVGNGGSTGSIVGNVLNNSALVFNRADTTSFAGDISGSGTLEKQSAGTLILTGANSYAGGTTITNGTIQVGMGGTTGSLAGNVTLQNLNSVLAFNRSDTITFGGIVSGTGSLVQGGTGTLVLTGANTYTGGTFVLAGRLRGDTTSLQGDIQADATLEFAQATTATFAGRLFGTGFFEKTGVGQLVLTGDNSNFMGETRILGGELRLSSLLSRSRVTVGNGAILSGTGVTGGLIVQSGGLVAPGNGGIGTLGVNGDIQLLGGSTLLMQVQAAGGDLLLGNGTVQLGGTLALINAGGNYSLNTVYVLVQTDAGRTGTFDAVTGLGGFGTMFAPRIIYTGTQVQLLMAPNSLLTILGTAPGTPNQLSALRRIDAAVAAGYDPTPLQSLYSLSPASALAAAADTLSGEIYPTATRIALDDERLVREAAIGRLRATQDAGFEEGFGAWGEVIGSWGSGDSDGNAAAYDRDHTGFLAGIDAGGALAGGSWRFGLLGYLVSTDIEVDARGSSAEIERAGAGAYAGISFGGFRGRAGITYSRLSLDSSRSVAFTGFSQSVAGETDGTALQGFGEVAYRFQAGARTHVEPFFQFSLANVEFDAFSESGGASRLRVARQDSDLVTTTLGLRGETVMPLGERTDLRLGGSLGARRVSGDRTIAALIAIDAAPGQPFAISAAALDRWSLVGALDATLDIGPAISLTIGYAGAHSGNASDHGVRATVGLRF